MIDIMMNNSMGLVFATDEVRILDASYVILKKEIAGYSTTFHFDDGEHHKTEKSIPNNFFDGDLVPEYCSIVLASKNPGEMQQRDWVPIHTQI